MEKTITFNIPEGYVIDKENSTADNIVLKSVEPTKVRTWDEYCKKMIGKNSYYFDGCSICCSKFAVHPIVSEFDNKEDAEALATYSQLLKLRKDWVGEWKPNWTDNKQLKYVIFTKGNELSKGAFMNMRCSMSFPTEKMRDEFFEYFKYYLDQAKDLI